MTRQKTLDEKMVPEQPGYCEYMESASGLVLQSHQEFSV